MITFSPIRLNTHPEIFRNFHPLYQEKSDLLLNKGNSIFQYDIDADQLTFHSQIPISSKERLFSATPFTIRILRQGIHSLRKGQGYMLAFTRGKLWKCDPLKNWILVFQGFKGSRPLNWAGDGRGNHYFGEYFGNEQREEVKVFGSSDGSMWEVAWTFPRGSIRHVHGIFWDSFRNGFWVTTGDHDEESAIWFTDDYFKTLEPIIKGSQMSRAVDIIPTPDGLIIPTDTPREKNWIQFYDMQQLTKVAPLIGSAFHAKYSAGMYFVSTVTEPSVVNPTQGAGLYVSNDGFSWHQIEYFPKDLFPVQMQKYTRYSEVEVVPSSEDAQFIVAFGRAIQKYDNSMLRWDKQDIIKHLNQQIT